MKRILDRYISRHYDEVRTYTEYFLTKFKANMIADVVINNSYLYVAEISDDTKDENKVKSYLLNTIKKQIIWSTSISHLEERVNANEIDIPNDCDDEEDLDHKIREEKKYHNQKSCIEIYKREVKDRIKLIIFDAYYEKGYTTARSMAKYFDIPVTSAHYYIRDIKHDLNRIKDENKSRIQG
jgi:hypothetical protein